MALSRRMVRRSGLGSVPVSRSLATGKNQHEPAAPSPNRTGPDTVAEWCSAAMWQTDWISVSFIVRDNFRSDLTELTATPDRNLTDNWSGGWTIEPGGLHRLRHFCRSRIRADQGWFGKRTRLVSVILSAGFSLERSKGKREHAAWQTQGIAGLVEPITVPVAFLSKTMGYSERSLDHYRELVEKTVHNSRTAIENFHTFRA